MMLEYLTENLIDTVRLIEKQKTFFGKVRPINKASCGQIVLLWQNGIVFIC